MKKRQLKKFLKKEAKNGFLACDGKLFYSNEKIINKLQEYLDENKPIPYTSIDKSSPINTYSYGMPVFKISERTHMVGIAMGAIA